MTGIRFRIDSDIARQAQLAQRIARGQADIASQKRLQAASDDPAAAARIAQLRRAQVSDAIWEANVESGSALAAQADVTLTSLARLFDRARELATNAASDTLSAADRNTIALELRSLADEVDSLAQTTDATGQPVFPVTPLAVPVGKSLTLVTTTSRTDAFLLGARDFGTVLRESATLIATGGAGRGNALGDITAASNQLSTVRGEQGTRAARLENLRDRLIDTATARAEERSILEDTDLAATIARVQADQLALDAARAIFARVNRRTLFDLLA
jgi:flagellar hook-associated protein 3 FlgL